MAKSAPTLNKSLRYSVVTKFINFDPLKYRPKTIIFNGSLAVHLKDNIYTKG